ncbi:DUF6264 family protein [Marisediminicola senii]|uniref:DUF6264 family protein n=1 Tax=Marisediminicola senii TaxID=2711233 RepID=UPI0013EA4552|nr:DUF6264 family protein [Marisediminicola senii]
MTNDERPRPRYGEYATPQQQAETVAHSLPPVPPVIMPADHAGAVSPVPTPPAAGTTGPTAPGAPGAPRTRRRWDLILSVALLAYGLFTVLSGLVQYSNLGAMMQQVYDTQGVGDFTEYDLARTIGFTLIVVNTVIYAITLYITVRLLRATRLAFYVPLIAGVLASIVTVGLIVTLMLSDPAFVTYLGNAS